MYTNSEHTVKKYTVSQAVQSAERHLDSMGIRGICINSVYDRDPAELITPEELYKIVDQIVWDTRETVAY